MNGDEQKTVKSVIGEHLGVTGAQAVMAAAKFRLSTAANVFHPFRKPSEANKSLDIIEDAIRRIIAGRAGITPKVMDEIWEHFCEDGKLPQKDSEEELFRTAMMALLLEPEKFLPAIETARGKISENAAFTYERSTYNVKAIITVDAAMRLWNQYHDKPAPRRLNPESPFANFLRDIFEATGTGGEIKSAHNAWVKSFGTQSA